MPFIPENSYLSYPLFKGLHTAFGMQMFSMTRKGQIVEIPATSTIYEAGATEGLLTADLLQQAAFPKSYSLFDGFLVGEHDGCEHFALGQRKGIGVGGKKAPLFVIGIDGRDNRVFVGEGADHPGLAACVFRFPLHHAIPSHNSNTATYPLSVRVVSAVQQHLPSAMLHRIGEDLFIVFREQVPVTILNGSLEVYTGQILHATIHNSNKRYEN